MFQNLCYFDLYHIQIIKNGARIADLGGEEIKKHIKVGESELEIAIAGRDRMEREIAKTYPDAEYMDTWVWFQSGLNTDGAHNPKTNRKLLIEKSILLIHYSNTL